MDTKTENYKKYQDLVVGKNINPQTLLATDYLNHFNEIHMLLGMIAEMPDCLEDILDWKAISYQDHFQISVFQDKDLAIEAYNHSPEKYKVPFENCVAEMDVLLSTTVSMVEEALSGDKMEQVNILIADYNPKMEKLIEECSGIINSREVTTQQDVIDDLFEDIFESDDSGGSDQSAIDDLFD